MTDVGRERIPLLWSTVKERALAQGFSCFNSTSSRILSSVCTILVCVTLVYGSIQIHTIHVPVFFVGRYQLHVPVVFVGRYQLSVTSTLPVPSGVSGEEDEQELLSHQI